MSDNWQTLVTSPSSTTYTDIVSLYITTETYQWGVTSHYTSSGYGKVTLNGYNAFTTILNGQGRVLTEEGTRNFVIYMDTSGQTYAKFKITMDYDSYPTSFSGYVKII